MCARAKFADHLPRFSVIADRVMVEATARPFAHVRGDDRDPTGIEASIAAAFCPVRADRLNATSIQAREWFWIRLMSSAVSHAVRPLPEHKSRLLSGSQSFGGSQDGQQSDKQPPSLRLPEQAESLGLP
jgi:hypothetical protein